MFEWEGERVSNIGIFESVSGNKRYKEKEDIFEGAMILKKNSKGGLCPHQHFQENGDDLQDPLISMGMVRIW